MHAAHFALRPILLSVVLILCLRGAFAFPDEPSDVSQVMGKFSESWDDERWEPEGRAQGARHMRPMDDDGWKERMKAFQALVAAGQEAVEPLCELLRNGSTPERILAAQTLGFIPGADCRQQLVHSAEHDPDPAVRLYAVDSLGMLGSRDHHRLFRRLQQSERNRGTRIHLAHALQRDGEPIEPSVTQSLIEWDTSRMDTARLGQVAPDFELEALDGRRIRLSDFHGQQPVVLVFSYGDT